MVLRKNLFFKLFLSLFICLLSFFRHFHSVLFQLLSIPFSSLAPLPLIGRNNYNGKCVQTRINGRWSSVLKCCHSIIKGRFLSSNFSTFSSLLPSFLPSLLTSFKIKFLFAIFFDLFFLGKGLLASLRLKGYQYCSINVNNNLSVYILLCWLSKRWKLMWCPLRINAFFWSMLENVLGFLNWNPYPNRFFLFLLINSIWCYLLSAISLPPSQHKYSIFQFCCLHSICIWCLIDQINNNNNYNKKKNGQKTMEIAIETETRSSIIARSRLKPTNYLPIYFTSIAN